MSSSSLREVEPGSTADELKTSRARPGHTEQVSRLRAFYFPRGRGSEFGQRGPGGEALNWGFMSLSYRLEEI
ncbi:hypothetical protein F7725_011078 [Dissostichus mawsoni]|uniref:Uncharacterized protein n=1 Tax=Dissostichus mawsoni TaxID=36200 RepID=A0A7J5ZB41_DISMA|nr:hypothetical protein F7725_011078 [Dissostichus mawsoni]